LEAVYFGRINGLDREIADRAGDLIAANKRAGRALSVPDAIIAATAIGHRLTLVTLNQGDFKTIAGLRLYALDDLPGD
jgi:toxin FitB